jgi:predicted membrane-bound spermidine synthase
LLSAAAGYITGYQFPLANNIYSPAPAAISRTGGLIYGVDLLGSCLGALLVSAFWVPILGIVQTCFAIALFNLVAFYRLKTIV